MSRYLDGYRAGLIKALEVVAEIEAGIPVDDPASHTFAAHVVLKAARQQITLAMPDHGIGTPAPNDLAAQQQASAAARQAEHAADVVAEMQHRWERA